MRKLVFNVIAIASLALTTVNAQQGAYLTDSYDDLMTLTETFAYTVDDDVVEEMYYEFYDN